MHKPTLQLYTKQVLIEKSPFLIEVITSINGGFFKIKEYFLVRQAVGDDMSPGGVYPVPLDCYVIISGSLSGLSIKKNSCRRVKSNEIELIQEFNETSKLKQALRQIFKVVI